MKPGPLAPDFAEEYGTDSLGLYWQDQIDLRPDLHILGGGRFDWASSTYRDLLTGEKYTDVSDRHDGQKGARGERSDTDSTLIKPGQMLWLTHAPDRLLMENQVPCTGVLACHFVQRF